MKLKAFVTTIRIIIILLIICNIAVAKSKLHIYMRNGLSFPIDDNWKIIANDSVGVNAYYFSAERIGTKATGLIAVDWINKVENPEKTITLHQQNMKSANIYRNPGIEFTTVNHEIFAGRNAVSCRYITFVKTEKLEGIIYCFNTAQKTITVFFQTGIEDQKLNQKAFELFKLAFNCVE